MIATRHGTAILALGLAACSTPPRDPRSEAPVIALFEAVPFVVRAPQSTSTVRWEVRGAEQVRLEGDGPTPIELPARGTRELAVSSTRTLTLIAASDAGESRAALVLTYTDDGPVRIDRFEVVPVKVQAGDAVTLLWDAPGSRGVFVRALDEQLLVADGAARGSITYVPRRDLRFELRADGLGGPRTATAAVTVVVAPPVIEQLSVMPVAVEAGAAVGVTWTARGRIDACTVSRRGPDGVVDDRREGALGAFSWTPSVGRHRVTLSCEGPGGRTETGQDVVVVAPLLGSITVTGVEPERSGAGGSVEVRFRTVGVERVVAHDDGGPLAQATAAEGRVRILAEAATFLVTLAPQGGLAAVATATITVVPEWPAVQELEAVSFGRDRVQLSWAVDGADRVRVIAEGLGTVLYEGAPESSPVEVERAPGVTWMILEFENAAGTTRRSVGVAPGLGARARPSSRR